MGSPRSKTSKTNGNNAARPRVAVRDNDVVLSDFHEQDVEVLGLARHSDDPEAAMHGALQVGARTIKLVQVSQGAQVVEEAFGRLNTKFDGKLNETLSEIGEAADSLFDENEGLVPQTFAGFRSDLVALLDKAFDPDSKKSVIGRFDEAVRRLQAEERKAMSELLDPGDSRSPLHRLNRDLPKVVREEAKEVRSLIAELSERIAVQAAEEDLIESTSAKGRRFEDVVHDAVGPMVEPYGDVAEATGDVADSSGRKCGDEVVTINEEDTRGAKAEYVLEAKTGKEGMKSILAELDEAMENRHASAAVAVFSRAKNSPAHVPFFSNGDKAIVVFDRDDADLGALRLATMWARWTVRRKLAEEGGEIDVEEINRLIDQAARALSQHSTVKGCHTSAKRKIDEAGRHVDALVEEVDATLGQVRAALDED